MREDGGDSLAEGMEAGQRLRINLQQARYFDGAVDVFDQEQPPHIMERLELIVEEARIQAGETVLDVGAGVGVLVPLIRRRMPGRIVACELSEEMLARLRSHHPEVEAYLGDVSDLPLPDASLDVVFMNAVFPNIVDKRAALGNCARMLRMGGRLVISHPEGRSFVQGIREVVPFPLDPLPIFPQLRRMLRSFPFKLHHYLDLQGLYVAVVMRQERRG